MVKCQLIRGESAMAGFAPLAQMALVRRSVDILHVVRLIHCHTIPLLQPVGNSFRIRSIKNRLGQPIACLTALEIDLGVVFLARIHSYNNSNASACPAARGTVLVVASELAHDVGVVFLDACLGIVNFVKVKSKISLFEKSGYAVVEFGI